MAIRATNANNRILLGYPGITPAGFEAFSVVSDARDKTDISDITHSALEFFNLLKPKRYLLDFRSNYVRYDEIDEDGYNALDRYNQLHRVHDVQVYGIEGTDIEWIEDEVVTGIIPDEVVTGIMPNEALTLSPATRGVASSIAATEEMAVNRYATKYISSFVSGRKAAFEAFKAQNLNITPIAEKAMGFVETNTDAKVNHSEMEDMYISSLIVKVRKAKFLRTYLESDGTKAGKRYRSGFLAQDVAFAADALGIDFDGVEHLAHNKDADGVPRGDDQWCIKDAGFTPWTIKAIQELSAENQILKTKLQALELRFEKLEAVCDVSKVERSDS